MSCELDNVQLFHLEGKVSGSGVLVEFSEKPLGARWLCVILA